MANVRGSKLSQIFLGAAGIGLFAAVFVFGEHLAEKVGVALVVAATALVVFAAFWSRIKGKVGITRDGLTIPIEAADRAEEQLQRGEVVEADKLPELLENIRQEIRDVSEGRSESSDPTRSSEAEDNRR